jgi:hypothetical protein
MTTNRTPIDRPRRAAISDSALSLFIELEAVPKRQLWRPEWRAKSRQLARLLGLTVEFWAQEHVNNASGPCGNELARETWHKCREVRKQLLAAARLKQSGRGAEPDHERASIQ